MKLKDEKLPSLVPVGVELPPRKGGGGDATLIGGGGGGNRKNGEISYLKLQLGDIT